ncbi:MAG: hypothetical protein AAF628_25330 [Planctomycetota bacterium]
MVKKTSILDKLKTRWKPASGMRVEAAADPGQRAAKVDSRFEEPIAAPVTPATPAAERVSGRKLSSGEEAVVAMGEGFRELGSLVRGVHTRMEDQGERAQAALEHVSTLPALGRAQLDLLRGIAHQLEHQGKVGDQLLATLGGLPESLKGVEQALERTVATDERTSSTLAEFRTTMDRIQGSMDRMVQTSAAQAAAAQRMVQDSSSTAEGVAKALRAERSDELQSLTSALSDARQQDVARLEKTSRESVEVVRKLHDAQVAHLDRLTREGNRFGQVVVVLLTMTFFALAGAVALLTLG